MDLTPSSKRIAEPDFRSLFEATLSPQLVLTPDLIIVAVNEAYLQATQQSRAKLVGCGIFEAFPDNPLDPAATGVANLRASLRRVLRNKVSDTMAIQKYDIPVAGPSGMVFEERYWSPTNTPVFDAQGELAYIIHRVEDVTEFASAKAKAVHMESEIFSQAHEIESANRRMREANDELERRVSTRTEELTREREHFRSFFDGRPCPGFRTAWARTSIPTGE